MIKQASHSSIWLGLLGGDWFYLSCGDPKFIAMGLIKLVLSSIGALLICYMFDWCIHLFNISKHPFSPKKYLLDYEPVFLGSTSILEARSSMQPPSLALSVIILRSTSRFYNSANITPRRGVI